MLNIMGHQIHVVPPHKTYRTVTLKHKGRKRTRYQKCYRHVGWEESIKDGQIIGDIIRRRSYANQKTFNELKNAIDKENSNHVYNNYPF